MARSAARAAAMQLVYENLMGGSGEDTLGALIAFTPEGDDQAYIDATVARYSTSRELARIARVDLCILRVALYEMKYSHEVAESIAINEAVELAKRFSEPASARFVNGMLGAISRGEQPEGKKDQPASKPEQKADEDGEKQDS